MASKKPFPRKTANVTFASILLPEVVEPVLSKQPQKELDNNVNAGSGKSLSVEEQQVVETRTRLKISHKTSMTAYNRKHFFHESGRKKPDHKWDVYFAIELRNCFESTRFCFCQCELFMFHSIYQSVSDSRR